MPVGAIKIYTSPSPLPQMGQFLMDKNCIFVDQFADVADNMVGKTWKLSVSCYLREGRLGGGGRPKAETEIS